MSAKKVATKAAEVVKKTRSPDDFDPIKIFRSVIELQKQFAIKKKNLIEVVAPLPNNGVGASVRRKNWPENIYWTITRSKISTVRFCCTYEILPITMELSLHTMLLFFFFTRMP